METEFDLTTDIRRMPVADNLLNGIVVDINADNFATGDTIPYFDNNGVEGYFEAMSQRP